LDPNSALTTPAAATKRPRVALIHYWLVQMRGGEKVLEALCEMYPDAHIYTHVVDRSKLSEIIKRHAIYTTFIAKLPFSKRLYQGFLPLMPCALEELDLSAYDLVISSESGPAKGVITRPDAVHLCYCHSPMRYIWDQYHVYRRDSGIATRLFMSIFAKGLRIWDQSSASRVDRFIANSNFVRMRIRKYYGRDAGVIFPPVELENFTVAAAPARDFYLCLGELVPYKKTVIAVEAFTRLGKRLVVVGDGGDRKKLEKIAGQNVEFLGRESNERIAWLYANCEALIFPGQEDFGIVPLEAMAAGRPVIAYRGGGALDTVVEGVTGTFFNEQTPESLSSAILRYEATADKFQPELMRRHASGFCKARFKAEIRAAVDALTVEELRA
jgi:glycosyltransferase involved in cell wall biosynthesis